MSEVILSVENGSFAYSGRARGGGAEKLILDNVNFELGSGEILAVLGPNGAGKTTMLRCVTDMLHWKSGRALLGGEDIRSMSPRKLWSRMAYVPQAKSAATSFTAFQTVLLGRSSRIGTFSSPKQADMDIAESVMERLGIAHLADKPCYAISGGELQMVLIARAMAAEPEILVLDEPESNLDFRNQLVVLDTMSELASEGVACVFNTHYPAHALQRADKSLLLNGDGTSIYGETTAVVTEDNIRKAFGVEAVIGEIETDANVMRNVVPVGIAREAGGFAGGGAADGGKAADGQAVASATIIMEGNDTAEAVNAILHEYNYLLIGRMGMPHRRRGLYIINVTLDGPRRDIEAMTHKLGLIRGISVKTTFARQ